jgi:hypothetical protein
MTAPFSFHENLAQETATSPDAQETATSPDIVFDLLVSIENVISGTASNTIIGNTRPISGSVVAIYSSIGLPVKTATRFRAISPGTSSSSSRSLALAVG